MCVVLLLVCRLHNNPAIPYYENEHNEANKERGEPGLIDDRGGDRQRDGARGAALLRSSVGRSVVHESQFGYRWAWWKFIHDAVRDVNKNFQ